MKEIEQRNSASDETCTTSQKRKLERKKGESGKL